MKIQLPEKVTEIISRLNSAGYEAYAVGGCVRDSCLGLVPDDWDITTSAKPEQVKALFSRTADTGIQHGTVTVLLGKEGFEVTTYRIDGVYEDGRRPKEVSFTASLEEDLKRRDFTINAMAYNDREGLIDIFDGLRDMKRKVLRCVGEPAARFTEDALRMMRAVRFSARLGYEIEDKTLEAIKQLFASLERISAERISAEFIKLITSGHPEKIRVCYETGLTKVFLPEFDRMMETEQNNPHHCCCVGEHAIRAMAHIRPEKALRLAALLHDVAKPDTLTTSEDGVDHFYGHAQKGAQMARAVLRRLKFDNETTDRVVRLISAHDVEIIPEPVYMRRAANRLGEDLISDLFALKEADMKAQSMYERGKKEEQLNRLRALYAGVCRERSCVSLKTLAVTGKDLIAAGMKPGWQIGEVLKRMLELVLDDPSLNNREYLLSRLHELLPEAHPDC